MRNDGELQQEIAEAGASVRYRFPWWLRPFLLRGVAGITLGRRIYIADDLRENELDRLVRHEMAHVRQITRVGLISFYFRYMTEYVRNRRAGMPAAVAYRSISFEREATAAETSCAETESRQQAVRAAESRDV